MASTFLMNDHPVVVLFDSGSSHSFMSTTFAHHINHLLVEVGHKYRISSAGLKFSQIVKSEGQPLELTE
jgi:hypothetical protein